ncbi:GIY-YIG nuclease family protein [Chloroflexota bacterium]
MLCLYHVKIILHSLYTGITNDLELRVLQHQNRLIEGFTGRYDITQLAYYACTDNVNEAIAREKQIKRMLRSKKIELIKAMNPDLRDLSEEWVTG